MLEKERDVELKSARRACKPELAGNSRRFEKPATISQLAEVSGGDWLAVPQLAEVPGDAMPEMFDPSAFSTKLPIAVTSERNSSPELSHPVNSDSAKSSLWQRRRGGVRRHSDGEKIRNDWPLLHVSENAISASSRSLIKPAISPPTALDEEDKVMPGNDFTSPISPDEPRPFDRSWMISPSRGPRSLPSDVLSPNNTLSKDMHPPLTIVSPSSENHNRSSIGGVPGETADRFSYLKSPHPRLALVEPNRVLSPYTPNGPYDLISRPISVSIRSPQLAFELEGFNHPDEFDKPLELEASSLTAKSFVAQIEASRSGIIGILPSELLSASPLRNPHLETISQRMNDFLPLPKSIRPATAFNASSLSNHFNSRTSIVTGARLPEMEMGDTNVKDGWDAAPRTSCSFSPINTGNGGIGSAWNVEPREGLERKDEEGGKFLRQDQETPGLGQSNTGHTLPFPDIQLRSPFDNLIATLTSELVGTAPDTYSDDEPQQTSALHHSRDFATSQAFSEKTLSHYFNCIPFPVGIPVPKHKQVEELQDLVHIVNIEWMQRMESLPALWLRCKTLLASSLFERAIRTLKEFICGKHPQTFEAVISIVHLALAAAHLSHWQHDFYSWHVLCNDALQWQHTLSIDEDKSSIVAAMSCWGFSELGPFALYDSSYTGLGSDSLRRSLHRGDWDIYHDQLRSNEVFRVCVSFLDGKSSHPRCVI